MQSDQIVTFVLKEIVRSENTTDCTEHSPWEAKSHPVSQEISCLSWNTKFFTTFTRTYHCTISWTTKI